MRIPRHGPDLECDQRGDLLWFRRARLPPLVLYVRVWGILGLFKQCSNLSIRYRSFG